MTSNLEETCPTALPKSCIRLRGILATDAGLADDVEDCIEDLGPFYDEDVSQCFAGGYSGNEVVGCLDEVLGVDS